MLKKIFSGLALIPLLVGILMLAFNTQLVSADWTWTETIYIRSDGSVYPDTAPISSVDSITYTLTDNIVKDVTSEDNAIVVERDNIVFDGKGFTVQGTRSETGIHVSGRSNITIIDAEILDFRQGISLSSSSNCNILKNQLVNNRLRGIILHSSSNNTIFGNNITETDWDGIWLREYSNNNTIYRNNLTMNHNCGIDISRWSEWNVIYENDITNNYLGIELGVNPAFNNSIYHNNFIGNTEHVLIHTSRMNFWDDGYPSGGNYWDDYTGVDEYQGINQDILDSDGVGDTPYVVDANNTDHFPIVHPYGSPHEGLWSLTRQIETMNLQNGIKKSLTTELRNAIESLDKDLGCVAITQLQAFMHHAEALKGKKLTDEQTNYLITEAQRIIGLIEE